MQFTCTIQTMAAPFTITDSHGQERYHVGTIPDIAERLGLRAAGGGQLAAIVRDPASGGFEVLIAGERAALVRFRGLIRVQCLVDTRGGSLNVRGDVLRGAYAMCASADIGADPQVQVLRQRPAPRYGVKYQVGINIADGEDPVQFIATVLGIEHLCEDRRLEVGDLRSGLGVILRLLGMHNPWLALG
jgi:hypothetical protein